jgi:hypothetical protein
MKNVKVKMVKLNTIGDVNMDVIKKKTRTYPNGAVINFMKWELCTEPCIKGNCAYYWEKGELLWRENEYNEEIIEIIYFKQDNDVRTNKEIDHLLKKQVRLFRSFYKSSKQIILKNLEELEERFFKLNQLEGEKLSKELFWLMTSYHALLCEKSNGTRYLDVEGRMMEIMRIENALEENGIKKYRIRNELFKMEQ